MPPGWLAERVKACPGAELHADVADVRPYLAQSGVMVVPLRIGGGSRLKILEALACGLPVVSTTVGAEGLRLRAGEDYVGAEGREGVARALIEAIREPMRVQDMARRARRFVLEQYDWTVQADRLEQVWENAVRGMTPRSAKREALCEPC
jgi:glycosyltransferase involved in cell wall biosynthesis